VPLLAARTSPDVASLYVFQGGVAALCKEKHDGEGRVWVWEMGRQRGGRT
jgi:hypothetical protein